MKKNILLLLLTAASTQFTAYSASAAPRDDQDVEAYESANNIRSDASLETNLDLEDMRHSPISRLFPNYRLPHYKQPILDAKNNLILPTDEDDKVLAEKFFGLYRVLTSDLSFNKNALKESDQSICNPELHWKFTTAPDSNEKRGALIAGIRTVVKVLEERNNKQIADLDLFFVHNFSHPALSSYVHARENSNHGKVNELYFTLFEQPKALVGKSKFSTKNTISRSTSAQPGSAGRQRTVRLSPDPEVRNFDTNSQELYRMHAKCTDKQPDLDELTKWNMKEDFNQNLYWQETEAAATSRYPHIDIITNRESKSVEQELDEAQETAESAVFKLFE